jgi:hypothetical protein
MPKASTTKVEVPLRILVLDPPAGVTFAVQRGRDELVEPIGLAAKTITLELTVLASGERKEAPRLTGPFAQGPPSARFVYVNSGTLAGQADSCWTRRAKVPLAGITWEAIDQILGRSGVLEASIGGTGRDGGPACASVPLASAWRPRPA